MPSAKGAPAQHSQSSRKGKKAWRKNVDIAAVEDGLEVLREEERVIGGPVHSKSNDQLFEVDTKGDEQVRKRLPKVSLKSLTTYKILSQRSAVPAVASRRTGPTINYEERKRMLKAGRRTKDLLDVQQVMLKTNEVKVAYGMWDGSAPTSKSDPVPINKPASLLPHRSINVPSIALPHAGTSYNPPVEAHQELLQQAHDEEEKRIAEEQKFDGVKEQMRAARRTAADDDEGVNGMRVDIPGELDVVESAVTGEDDGVEKKLSKPKTKKQRRKAAILLLERRSRASITARKRQLETITARNIKAFKSDADADVEVVVNRKTDLPVIGTKKRKLGKHSVPAPRLDVQLGEELSENLRGLQPEGSLFRDRFESLQQRALVEPRVRVVPRRQKTRIKDYEKHAWKRFH